MGSLAAEFTWTNEDDFKLRKAAEVSDHMLEFEHSYSTPVIKVNESVSIKEIVPISGKRKSENISKRFYTMRKKMREQDVSSNPPNEEQPSLDGFGGPLQNNEPDINLDFGQQTLSTDERLIDPVEETDDFAEVLELLEFDEPELPLTIDQTYTEEHNEYRIVKRIENLQAVEVGDAELANLQFDDATKAALNSTNSYLLDISNELFDLKDMDYDIPLVDAYGNVIDKNDIDRLSSYLLDSPKKVAKCHITDNNQPQYENFAGFFQQYISPTSGIICSLNTEDPEIPINDDVFLLNFVPSEMQSANFKIPPRVASKSVRNFAGGSKRGLKVSKTVNRKAGKSEVSSPIIGSQLNR